ncbi:MAG: FtsX-like permease family protein [Vicinamibacteria bacterium]
MVTDLKGEIAAARVGGRRFAWRDGLVVAQVAVTALLLVCAGLLLRSTSAAEQANVGFRPEGLAIVGFDLAMAGYDEARAPQFFAEAERRLAAMPGVTGVARASRLPFSLNFNTSNIAVPGHQQTPEETGRPIDSAIVSPGYFETIGIPLVQGRAFAESDTPDRPRVAVINETMARQFWPEGNALGQLVYELSLSSGRAIEIVGVVADHRIRTVGEPALPALYMSTTQRPSSYGVLVARTAGDERALLDEMRRTLLAMEPDVLFMDNQTMREQMSAMLFPVKAAATLVAAFGAVGLLLAAIGLYGVIAFSVARRTREIGIRMAIGARPASVLTLVLRQGAGIAGVGLLVGGVLAAAATQVVAGALYGVGVADPVAWGGAAAALLAIALVANLIPARRAMRIDPIRALRAD